MRTLILLIARPGGSTIVEEVTALRELFMRSPAVGCLVIEDAGPYRAIDLLNRHAIDHPWPGCVLVRNEFAQGHGGIQKAGFRYAMEQGFDAVVFIRAGDTSYLAVISEIIERFSDDSQSDYLLTTEPLTFASAFLQPQRLLQQFISRLANRLSGARIPDWYGPLRIYRTAALRKIAFELNTHDGHFDAEIILQLLSAKRRAAETITIQTLHRRLGKPLAVNAWQTFKAALKFRLQKYNLFYDFRYHPNLVKAGTENADMPLSVYTHKADSSSPHSLVCRDETLIPSGSRVLDLGCSTGYVAAYLATQKKCTVVGVDMLAESAVHQGFDYHQLHLENDIERVCGIINDGDFDVILILDVLEHLVMPELFLLAVSRCRFRKLPRIIVSTGNVGFIVVRCMLLAGFFNYGNRGILDITHKRLFTLRTFKNLLDQTGFTILKRHAFPLPWKELGLSPSLSRAMDRVQNLFVWLRPTLFAYQVLYVTVPVMMPYKSKVAEAVGATKADHKKTAS